MCFSCLLEIGSQSGRGFILGKQTWWFLLDGSLKPLQTCIISTQKGKSPPQGSVTKPAYAVQCSFICPFHLWEKHLFRLYYHSNTTTSHSFLFAILSSRHHPHHHISSSTKPISCSCIFWPVPEYLTRVTKAVCFCYRKACWKLLGIKETRVRIMGLCLSSWYRRWGFKTNHSGKPSTHTHH